jgi:hypothetical protein
LKVYLAARYSRREELAALVPDLAEHGLEITSSWLNSTGTGKLPDRTFEENQQCAIMDLEDIDMADTVILFSEDPTVPTLRGGRHFESGYALGCGKELIIIGPLENVFHFHPKVKQFATIDDYLFG